MDLQHEEVAKRGAWPLALSKPMCTLSLSNTCAGISGIDCISRNLIATQPLYRKTEFPNIDNRV